MKPYFDRMCSEYYDLKGKIERAEAFINSNPKIPSFNLSLLKSQVFSMKSYLQILELRIELEDDVDNS